MFDKSIYSWEVTAGHDLVVPAVGCRWHFSHLLQPRHKAVYLQSCLLP